MDLAWLSDPTALLGLLTLIILEIVLGIDNLIFVAILAEKLPPAQRDRARVIGLSLALLMRLGLLAGMSWLVTLTSPLFSVFGQGFSGRDLIMLVGGLFLLFKATMELHERLEGHEVQAEAGNRHYSSFAMVVTQILILDAVFSLDSVITAVGMVEHLEVMMIAVVVAMVLMIAASKPLTRFVNAHPTVVMLCLGFLLMIGFSLVADGFGMHIPKGYLYAAIGFSVLIEMFNQLAAANRNRADRRRPLRERTADAVLGLLGARPLRASAISDEEADDTEQQPGSGFDERERQMIQSVLTLAERPVRAIMTPRHEVERLDLADPLPMQLALLRHSTYSRLVVVQDGNIDEPLGIVAKKQLLGQLLDESGRQPGLDVAAALRQPLAIPETVSVLRALELFRQQSAEFAFVLNEFGILEGIVTHKDLMEAIAGEFPEEHQRDEPPALHQLGEGHFEADAGIELSVLEQTLELGDYPPGDFHTLGGLLMAELERIPLPGDALELNGWRITVKTRHGKRIGRVELRVHSEA